ncbi:hypothetical protein BDN70DRAFT_894366 [Pholiota conissans]|uniref:Uncharacterized protein n=1 Tax=Pholiota conissans TaxID=109636 RepID=A0A9P6CU75_9AGAR|nr:hypothetical protein BDN70DRAFT_894366 [Pholiota conissans]
MSGLLNISDASDCFTAQTIPELYGNDFLNPDVGGLAVAMSTILLRWGDNADVQTTIIMLLTQVYPVILATATSINTRNLSLFDAHFAIVATASPVSIYLVYSSFRDFIGLPSSLFNKLTHGKKVIRLLGLTLPIIWTTINILISFSPRAFRNSPQNCQKISFVEWIQYQTLSNFVGILDIMGQRDLWNDLNGRGGLGTLALITMWIWAIYMVYHRYDIVDEMRFRRQNQIEQINDFKKKALNSGDSPKSIVVFLHHFRRAIFPLCNLVCSSWNVITSSHPWMIFAIIMFLHWSWILGLQKGMLIERYQLSYGQILSLFSVILPLASVARLLLKRREDFTDFICNLWPSFLRGLRFLVTKKNPYLGRMFTIWVVSTTADIFWIIGYVDGGSKPNPRTPVNDPHKAWKPYSISSPLFAPFAALPLAQQWQWTHFCDSFAGEVELQGVTNPFQTPLAHFHYPHAANDDVRKNLQYDYALVRNDSAAGLIQDFIYAGPFNTLAALPEVLTVSYNLADHTFSVYCLYTSSKAVPCATGSYTTSPYLSFIIHIADTDEEIRLRAQDKEWGFSNDAPSFVLKFEDAGGQLGDIDLQSAVTKRSHCEILKICASSGAPDIATLVPLGIVLMTQDEYSQYCLLPRLYSV